MIEVIITNRHNPSRSNSNLMSRILALLCIVNYCELNGRTKGASLSQIQCYLWGVLCERNTRIMSEWNRNGCLETPYISGENTLQELACCEINGYLKQEKGRYEITEKARILFRELKDDEILMDILGKLKSIGVISDKKSKELKKDWSYAAY